MAPSLTYFPLDVHQDPSHDIYAIIILDNGIMMDKVLGWVPENLELIYKYVRSYLCISVSTEAFLQA